MSNKNIKNNVEFRNSFTTITIENDASVEEQLLYNLTIQMELGFITRCNAKLCDSGGIELTLQYEESGSMTKYNPKLYLKDRKTFEKYFKII